MSVAVLTPFAYNYVNFLGYIMEVCSTVCVCGAVFHDHLVYMHACVCVLGTRVCYHLGFTQAWVYTLWEYVVLCIVEFGGTVCHGLTDLEPELS